MEVTVIQALRVSRSQMIEVTGADLERVREFLIMRDARRPKLTLQTPWAVPGGFGSPTLLTYPEASLAAGLWESPGLRCAMLRRDLLLNRSEMFVGSRYDDTLLCWWKEHAFEVRDVGTGRIVSLPSEDPRLQNEVQEQVFRRVQALHEDPDNDERLVSGPRTPGLWFEPFLAVGTWGEVRYLHWCWTRKVPYPGRGPIVSAPRDWFPEELVTVWDHVSTTAPPVTHQ